MLQELFKIKTFQHLYHLFVKKHALVQFCDTGQKNVSHLKFEWTSHKPPTTVQQDNFQKHLRLKDEPLVKYFGLHIWKRTLKWFKVLTKMNKVFKVFFQFFMWNIMF